MKQKIMKIHKEIKNFFSAKLLLISSHGPDVRGLWAGNGPRAGDLKPLV